MYLGTAGLPHILIRFFTVKDAITARKSVIHATWIIGIFYILTIFLGFGAAAFVGYDEIVAANAAGNMAAPLLAQAIGGDFLFAFVSAVAFATILAVVAGLVLSAASAFAHDFYGHIIRKGKVTEEQQVLLPVCSTWCCSLVDPSCTMVQNMNVAFLVSIAFVSRHLRTYQRFFLQSIGNDLIRLVRFLRCCWT